MTLNDYVDRALPGAEQADVERHLDSCAACRALVDDLREIRRATKALAPIEPPAAVWRRIEKAIHLEAANLTEPAGRKFGRLGGRQIGWLAAAALLSLATLVGLRLGPLAPSQNGAPSSASANGDAAQTVEWELRQAEEHYDRAIKGLEQIANEGQSELDPATAATLQKNLAVIDLAISESRAAVRAEPGNEPAQASLLENFTTKIALLQDTVSLINEMRKGNDAGAAQIISGLK
ncbi:MAG: zf-HC2 domain-containing protein [Acidobacteria bacterium]|nr:zf-HC2 domain-containing protein [Acidobacteriota bacterium]